MSSKIFDPNVSYVDRFVKKQSKRVKMPTFKYLDAKFHPKHKDHIVILSSNDFPEDVNMTYSWDQSLYGIDDLDTKYPKEFEDALNLVESESKRSGVSSKGVALPKDEKFSSIDKTKSPTVSKADDLLNESKQLGLVDSDEDSYDYDGGESDEEEKEPADKKDGKKGGKKDKSKDDKKNKKDKKDKIDHDDENEDDDKSEDSKKKKSKETASPKNSEKKQKSDKDKESDDEDHLDKTVPIAHTEKELTEDKDSEDELKNSKKNGKKVEEDKEKEIDGEHDDDVINGLTDKDTKEKPSTGMEDSEHNEEVKDEATVAPKDETEDSKEQSEAKEEEPDKSAISLKDRFLKLTDKEKQRVVDLACDSFIPTAQKNFTYNYHNFAKGFEPQGYEVPETEKLVTNNNASYAETSYCSWYPNKKFEGIEYRPPIIRHKYQISIWKVDHFGCVKIKDNYITPKFDRCKAPTFTGFKLKNSLDKTCIFLEEVEHTENKKIVILLDAFTLSITHELEVQERDPDFTSTGYDNYYDYYDCTASKFPTKSVIGRVNVFNGGKNLIVGVGTPSQTVHYSYAIYDTETSEIVTKVEREEDDYLYGQAICFIQEDPNSPTNLIFTHFKENTATVSSLNCLTGIFTKIGANNSVICQNELPTGFRVSASGKTCFIRCKNCMHEFGVNENKEVDLYNTEKATVKYEHSTHASVQGDNFLMVGNDELNQFGATVRGKLNFTRKAVQDNITQYYDIVDTCITDNNEVMCISNLTNSSLDVHIFSSSNDNGGYVSHKITETTSVRFWYPSIMIVKGCNEVLIYSITEKKYYYIKLNAPVGVMNTSVSSSYSPELKCLLDLGDYYTFASMTFTTGSSAYFSGSFYKRYIEKDTLPTEKVLTCLDMIKIKYLSKEEDSFVIQCENSIFTRGTITYDLCQISESDYNLGEVISIPYVGLLCWQKNKKSIVYKANPINFTDRTYGDAVFESSDFIKSVKCVYDTDTYSYSVLIVDEKKYIKTATFGTNTAGKYVVTMKTEYYVNNMFTGDSEHFVFSNKMLYEKFCGYLCQERGKETEDLALDCEPDDLGLDSELMDPTYPLVSKSWLLFYGVKESDDNFKKENEVLLLPLYNQPKVTQLDSNSTGYYKSEFFYYHDTDYIIYIRMDYSSPFVSLEVYKRNGDFHQLIKITIKNCYDHSYAKVIFSPSGRYLFYVEDVTPENAGENPENQTKGRIMELVHDRETMVFSLKEIRVIDDFKERYDKQASSVNTYDYYSSYQFYLTDKMELLFVDKTENKVMYEEIKCEQDLEKKLGRRDYNEEEFRTISDLTWIPKNGGFAAYSAEEVYFLRINYELRTVMPIIMCNFQINKGQMTVNQVCASPSPKLIVIALLKGSDTLLLVWDIEKNCEVYNFSTSKTWYFLYGPRTEAGYILNGDTYVNLDRGLINYFFEYDFQSQGFYDQKTGYKINKDEDVILEYGNLITKETMIEVYSTDLLKDDPSQLNEDNINLERIRFQVDGNTSLHFYALDYNTLSLILNYMDDHRPEYLTAILMKNNKNKSPLDISIDNESPKNTELFLMKLIRFTDYSLSGLFYDRFNDLLNMNIGAFHQYLDSCVFQTIQMKATKYLKLKSDIDPWLVTHSSCLIDEVFIDKYCDTSEKKALEAEKKKKEEEEKKKAEEDKQKEEERKKAEEEGKKFEEDKKDNEMNKESMLEKGSDDDLLDASDITKKVKTKEELQKEKERMKQKRLDIKAIEFDWIFNEDDGKQFLKTLADTDNIDLFSLTLIRYIIKFLWGSYRRAIVIWLFIPYLLYFSLFLVYTTWIHKRMKEEDDDFTEGFGLANSISIAVLLIFVVYFAYFELRQIFFHKYYYFISFWNMVDLASLVLNTVILISDIADLKEQNFVTLSGIAVLLVWLKLFYFGRIFLSTAAMIRMIIEITVDMKYFLLVFLLAVAGFGNCFFILARNMPGMFTGGNYFRAFIYSYNTALGEFDTESFDGDNDEHLLYTLWVLDTVITLIIFLNLIIAIMGDTFDRVQETADNNKNKELASIMVENELLINRKRLFGDAKYIIIIQEEKAEEGHESWEGRLQHLKKYMDKAVADQNKLLKDIEKKILDEVKHKTEKRGKELEVSASKFINILWEKSDNIQLMLDEKVAEYTPSEDEKKGN